MRGLRNNYREGYIEDEQSFRRHVSELLGIVPGVQAINFIDDEGVIRWVVPEEPNRGALGSDLNRHPVAGPNLREARAVEDLRTTPAIDLLQSGRGFACYLPIIVDGRTVGYLNAVFRLDAPIRECLEGVSGRYEYFISEADDVVLVSSDAERVLADPLGFHAEFGVNERTWLLTLSPSPELLAATRTPADEAALIFGLLVATGVGFGAWRLHLLRRAARRSEASYREIVETANDGISTVDGRSVITFVNRRMADMLGYLSDAMVGHALFEFLELDTETRASPSDLSVRGHHEVCFRHRDGSSVRALISTAPMFDEQGSVIGALSMVSDVTTRWRAEQALRQSERRYRDIVEDQTEFIVHWKVDGSQTFVNESFCRHRKTTRDAMIGCIHDRMNGSDGPQVLAHAIQTLTPAEPIVASIHRHVTPDGSISWEEWTDRGHFDAAGRLTELHSVGRDITEEKLAQERQTRLVLELDHRVKNNLASVLALADQTIGSTRSLRDFSAAFTSRLHAMARTHEALTRSRWDGVGLKDAIAMITAPFAGESPRRIQMEGDDLLLAAEVASPVCPSLHELATNAAKYGALSSSGGRVEVRWRRAGEFVRLEWIEIGGPALADTTKAGLGLELIRGFIVYELGGEVGFDLPSSGAGIRLTFPTNRRNFDPPAAV